MPKLHRLHPCFNNTRIRLLFELMWLGVSWCNSTEMTVKAGVCVHACVFLSFLPPPLCVCVCKVAH